MDLLIIGLMLLGAVHGLRLGALIQILTFGGFWLGFLLGTVIWVPLLSTSHDSATRSILIVGLVMATACGLGYVGRIIGTYSNITLRRHHLGNVDAVLGVGVAVVAVLLSVWLVAAVISSPNSRFTSLDAAVARSDILHSIDRVLPQAPSIFNDLQNFLNDQGFPQVFSTLTPPSTPSVRTADERADQGARRPGGVLDGEDPRHRVHQRAGRVGLRGRSGPRRHERTRRRRQKASATRRCSWATRRTPPPRCTSTPPSTSPSCGRMRPSGRSSPSTPMLSAMAPRPPCWATPRTDRSSVDPASVTQEVTAVGKDIYNSGSVTRGVYALGATVLPGNSGGPLMGPGGQVIGVVFSRSTVYANVGYALTSPGVLTRVEAAEQHRSAVSTGPCISG